jgi:hypothetical protein
MLSEALEEVTEPGTFRLMIGGSSKDIRLRTVVELGRSPGTPRR